MQRFTHCLQRLLLCFILFLYCNLHAHAQSTATVSGFVNDASNKPIPGATVTVKNESTGFIDGTVSNEKGYFLFRNLTLGGPYTVTATIIGYNTEKQTGYTLTIGENLKLQFRLNDKSSELQEVIIRPQDDIFAKISPLGTAKKLGVQELKALPSYGRNFQDLASLSPMTGVSPSGNPNLVIGGARESSTGVTLDGMSQRYMMNGGLLPIFTVSIEAVKEYEVATNNYDVLQGRQGGGSVNVITKSGTNDFTGSAFFYNRSNRLTSKNDYLGRPQKNFNINQYGASLGGPIIKNKLHFFAAFDFEDRSTPVSVLDVRDLTTEKVEKISRANLDRFLNILSTKYGLSDPASQTGLFSLRPISRTFFGRLDWQLNSRNKLTFRGNYSSQKSEFSPYAFPDNSGVKESYAKHEIELMSFMLNLKTSFSAKLNNDLKVQYLKAERDFLPYSNLPRGFVNIASVLEDGTKVSRNFQFGGNRIAPEKQGEKQLQLVENLYLQTGKFNFTFGTDNIITFTHTLNSNEQGGLFQFDNLDALDNLKASSYSRLVPLNPVNGYTDYLNMTTFDVSAYAQAEYAINPKMNIRGGLRWDATVFATKPGYNPLVDQVLGQRTDKTAGDYRNIQPRLQFTYDIKGDQSSMLQVGAGAFSANIVHWAQLSNILQTGLNLSNVVYPKNGIPTPDYISYRKNISNVPGVPPNSGAIPPYVNLIGEDFRAPMTWKANASFRQFFHKTIFAGVNIYYAYTNHNFRYVDQNMRDQPDFRLDNEGGRGVFAPANTIKVADKNPDAAGVVTYPVPYNAVTAHPELSRVLALNGDAHLWQIGSTVEAGIVLPKNGLISASYTYNKTEDDNSYNCCIARTSASGIIADDPRVLDANRGSANGDFRHKVIVYGISPKFYGLQLGVKYVGISGNPWTPVVFGDITGDGSSLTINNNKRAFLFDPATISANPNATPFEKRMADDLVKVMANSNNTAAAYMKSHLGQMAGRNVIYNKFWSNIDISLTYSIDKDLIKSLKKNRLILEAQVFNFGNLINKSAGKQMVVPGDNQQLLKTVGLDPYAKDLGKNQYAYIVNPLFGQAVPANAPYQVQLGLRYEFQ